ncbi:hypothetical protein NECAME_01585 [Necator americanus]|uniref:Uncharacterized protein n=1 Tax=Necator americanus TaxID=51031 RepID=W2TQN2_NECAM|nr:hypothetical protein NECAME_01585 [Necator americanus]ETN84365.1 hypothetical protein NECAME_01585 [Necator americanus]
MTVRADFTRFVDPIYGVYPSLDNSGINAGVGYQTAIALTSTRTKRAKKPYGRCIDKESDTTNLYQVSNI